jgi:HAD superfamily hydrolase (TIGR01662 family)
MRTFRHVITALALMGALGCAQQPDQSGSLGWDKGEFGNIDIELPCIAPASETAPGELSLSLGLSGRFAVEVSQPETHWTERALGRVRIDDGERSETSESDHSPSLEWDPASPDVIPYTITIINRSSEKVLCGRFRAESRDEEFRPPTVRRTFAQGLRFDADVESVPVAFFDADSTLRVSSTGWPPNTVDDVTVLPGVAAGINRAIESGFLVVVVSNQGGVSDDADKFAIAEGALAEMIRQMWELGAPVHYFDFAEHRDEDRKPETGMARRFEEALQESFSIAIDWDRTFMVGDAAWKRDVDTERTELPGGGTAECLLRADICIAEGEMPDEVVEFDSCFGEGMPGADFSNSDRGLAENLGIADPCNLFTESYRFHHPKDYFGWSELGIRNFRYRTEVEEFWAAHPDFPN